jgi:hypothetical protein
VASTLAMAGMEHVIYVEELHSKKVKVIRTEAGEISRGNVQPMIIAANQETQRHVRIYFYIIVIDYSILCDFIILYGKTSLKGIELLIYLT